MFSFEPGYIEIRLTDKIPIKKNLCCDTRKSRTIFCDAYEINRFQSSFPAIISKIIKNFRIGYTLKFSVKRKLFKDLYQQVEQLILSLMFDNQSLTMLLGAAASSFIK